MTNILDFRSQFITVRSNSNPHYLLHSSSARPSPCSITLRSSFSVVFLW